MISIFIIDIFNVIYLLNDTLSLDVIYFYVIFIYTDVLFIHILEMRLYVIILCDNIFIFNFY